jgi:hypothetical protein
VSAAAVSRMRKAADAARNDETCVVLTADVYRVLTQLEHLRAKQERELSLTQALRRIKEAMDS